MKPDIQSLFDKYIQHCKFTLRRRPETLRGYDAAFKIFIKLCPDVSLGSLASDTITSFFDILQNRERKVGRNQIKKGVKDSTIATYARKLHTFFEWLVASGHISANPLRDMPRIHPSYDDLRALKKEQIDKIRTAIEISHNLLQVKRDRLILSLLIFCGLRRGELLGLQITDVDLQKETLKIRSETSKSKHSRMLPLHPTLRMHLEDYLHERHKCRKYTTPTLIVSLERDSGLTKDGLKHWVEKQKELSGVKFHLHQFRHTFATNLGLIGINAIQLQRLLGHTDLRMTQRYVRSLTVDDLRPAVGKLSFEELR